jgi:hypothetical protein
VSVFFPLYFCFQTCSILFSWFCFWFPDSSHADFVIESHS